MGSSMLAPAVPDVMKSLHSDNAELQSFVVSIYVIGFVVGPLVVAPLSELFGRAIVYHVSNVVFLGATIGCALSTNVGMFLAFRLLCGCAGAAPLALGGGSISDIMEPERMGTAMAVWGLGSLVPPVGDLPRISFGETLPDKTDHMIVCERCRFSLPSQAATLVKT